jgi:hypothetical protein
MPGFRHEATLGSSGTSPRGEIFAALQELDDYFHKIFSPPD